MAPARLKEPDSDPVTAEYDVYLTPSLQHQIYLLQYPNRSRDRPCNARTGVRPEQLRIKPESGYLELDVSLNTEHNFNKYQGLKWGEATQESTAGTGAGTYGIAAGLTGPPRRPTAGAGRGRGRDGSADRELRLQSDITLFYDAKREGRVLHTQTLGGQISKHDSAEEAGKPAYFVGAFKGGELHLSQVNGTVQMRPLFHHLDASDHQNRAAARESYAAAAEAADGGESAQRKPPEEKARILHQSYKPSIHASQRSEFAENSHALTRALRAAAEEKWVPLEYIDEDDDEAYDVWHDRMFVKDTGACAPLQAAMKGEGYLDALSAPGRESVGGKKKRRGGKKDVVDVEDGDGDEGG